MLGCDSFAWLVSEAKHFAGVVILLSAILSAYAAFWTDGGKIATTMSISVQQPLSSTAQIGCEGRGTPPGDGRCGRCKRLLLLQRGATWVRQEYRNRTKD